MDIFPRNMRASRALIVFYFNWFSQFFEEPSSRLPSASALLKRSDTSMYAVKAYRSRQNFCEQSPWRRILLLEFRWTGMGVDRNIRSSVANTADFSGVDTAENERGIASGNFEKSFLRNAVSWARTSPSKCGLQISRIPC